MKKIILKLERFDEPIFQAALSLGIRDFYIDPSLVPEELRKGLTFYGPYAKADVKVQKGEIEEVELKSQSDIESLGGAKGYLVRTKDWRVIPLENLIAAVEGKGITLLAEAKDLEDAVMLYGVLEKGMDGVIISPKGIEDLYRYADALLPPPEVELVPAEVVEVKLVGMGERVCVDTSNMLKAGEGMLIGSFSNFLFLVHGETIGSKFTAPRPFRVNAGGVHNYILLPDGKTRYLSEISAGDEVLVVNHKGKGRRAVVGRAKVERRPLVLIRARAGESEGTVILQYAETIMVVSEDGNPLAVSDLKKGDKVLAYVPGRPKGRHFGMAVDEFILEK